ncbi:hypothetical protein REH81_00945 [Vibrio rotiferianus]
MSLKTKFLAAALALSCCVPGLSFAKTYTTNIDQRDSMQDALPKLYYKAILDQVCSDMPSQCLAALKNPDSVSITINNPVKYSTKDNHLIATADISIDAIKVDLSLANQTYPLDYTVTIENTLLKVGSYTFQKRYISNL